jgi:hypothetical protein
VTTRATRTRQATGGEDRPATLNRRDPAPVDSQADAARYPVLHGPLKPGAGQTAGRLLPGLTGPLVPDPETPAALAAPGRPAHLRGNGDNLADLRAKIAVRLRTIRGMSDSSRGENPPQEKSDMCPCSVVVPYRLPDGRLLFKRVPCRTKACEVCGPRLRLKWAQQWAHAMAGDVVYRQVVDEGEPARMRRRKAYHDQELGHLPAPDGKRVVYSTAPIGLLCEDVPSALASDFAAMPDDRRNKSLVGSWGQVVADAEAEAIAKRPPLGECLGRVTRSLEHVEMIARELGLFLGRSGTDGVLVADPGDALLWARFANLIGLVGVRRRREGKLAA